jgi:SAM-dependent methyltransferase
MASGLLGRLFSVFGQAPGPVHGTTAAPRPGDASPQHPIASLSAADRQQVIDDIRAQMVREMFELTTAGAQPNTSPFNERLRDLPAMRWNIKVLGADLAARHYGQVAASRQAVLHDEFALAWQPTRFNDYLQAWFLDACSQLRMAPVLHRKVWEEAYVLSTLRRCGKLAAGCRGIVFGVGQERLPAYIASTGAQVLATDLAPDSASAKDWIETAQHGSLERLFYPEYLSRPAFDAAVRFRYADMNAIADELDGQFDFCWSVCAFEHLGSIDKGLRFVERTGRLLKPGGVSVHTTEFNYTSNDDTIDNWGTVLFRRRDFEQLADRLRTQGYELPPVGFDVGATPVDQFIDIPPYPQHKQAYYHSELNALHLKLLVDGFPATCYGLSFRRPQA